MFARVGVLSLCLALGMGGTTATAVDASPPGPSTVPALAEAFPVLQGLVESVTATTTSTSRTAGAEADPVGWLLSAAGIAVSAATAAQEQQELDEISSQLTQVQDSLTTIQGEIQTLSDQIAALQIATARNNCSVQTQFATQALSTVQTANQQYTELVSQAASASTAAPAPTMAQLVDWADEWVTPLQESINDIDNVVGGTTSDAGSLQACAAALAQGITTGAWQFETQYYTTLYSYVGYWYNAEVTALNLYVEAQHMLAVSTSGQAAKLQATNPSAVCDPPIAQPATVTACNSAQDMVGSVTGDLTSLLTSAGAAYGWGSGGQIVAGPPVSGGEQQYAWLLDINDFQTSGCTLPVSSTSPCGGSVGTSSTFASPVWGGFTWGSYDTWEPAPTAAWLGTRALGGTPGNQVWQQLAAQGLGDTAAWGATAGLAGLIIYTGETTSSQQAALDQSGYQNSISGQCLFDTSFWLLGMSVFPLCDAAGGGNLSELVANYDSKTQYWGPWPNAAPFQTTVPSFYAFTLSHYQSKQPWNVGTGGVLGPMGLTLPQWATATQAWLDYGTGPALWTQNAAGEYRWPVVPLVDSMCTVTVSGSRTMAPTTASGVATMCGADMAAWLAVQVPQPPPASSPVSLTAEHGLGSAKLTWRPGSSVVLPLGYRIRGKRDGGTWRTLARDTSSRAATGAAPRSRTVFRVAVPHQGTWRFKVTTLTQYGHSKPSKASRPEYVPSRRHAKRFYVFRSRTSQRVVEAFADGRVYWAGRRHSGAGVLRGHTIRGSAYPTRFTARPWRQRASGSWRNLGWTGWQRLDGPALTRRGMPMARVHLPRY